MLNIVYLFTGLLGGIIIGAIITFAGIYFFTNLKFKKTKIAIQKLTSDAEKEADRITKNAHLEAKTTIYELKLATEKELKEKKSELSELENKLFQREQNLENRNIKLLNKEETLEEKNTQIDKKIIELDKKETTLFEKEREIILELEKKASMTQAQAKDELFEIVKDNTQNEMALYIKNKEEEANQLSKVIATEILSNAISRYSNEVTSERTVSVINLPSEEMKGRIIGREGRNIKSIELLTGVDIIIDDTPEIITVSCFDPIRRENARVLLEMLIKDGRIQPGRIEETFEKAKLQVKESIMQAGEEALLKLGLGRMHKDLIELLGRLKYRTSYSQNALLHSIEVASLCGIMAAELGLNQNLAKRAGLLHDIGKALDFEVEGTHVELGLRVAKKYNEHPVVLNGIVSHHGNEPANHPISFLVAAADTLSAARPGARSEMLENFIKRVEKLEEISKSFTGVSQAYAIQAGREIRVMVVPDKIDDIATFRIAREIKQRIENEMTYPGNIKITVIREMRSIEIAK